MAKGGGGSLSFTWPIIVIILLIAYLGYRNYDQNGNVFNFAP